jgi:CRP-like cAMP-binding protein
MPLFAKESMKRLPPKLRQMIRGQQEDVVRSDDGERPLSRGGKSLRGAHLHVDQDERAVSGRKSRPGSRPGSAIQGRRHGGGTPEAAEQVLSGAAAMQAVEELVANDKRQLRRTSSAPMIGGEARAQFEQQQLALAEKNALISKSASASPKADQHAAVADSKMAAKLLGGMGMGSLKRSGTARQLTRRRSSISLGKSGGRRGSMSKQKREQTRRDERRAVQAKLRSVLGKMTHRRISSGWAGWLKFVEDHRYRDVASAAQSVLIHIPSEQRNPNDVKQVASWLRQMKLECLRPLTEGVHKIGHGGDDDSSGGGSGGGRGRSSSIDDKDKAGDKSGGGGGGSGDGGQKAPVHSGADDSLLQVLCRRASLKKYKKGEIMFWQTDFGDHYHVVLSGQVGIYANSKRALAAKLAKEAKAEADRHSDVNDHPNSYLDWSPAVPARNRLLGRWICNYNVGGAFGELALVSWDRERKASAIANEDNTMVLLVDRWSYNKCLWHLHQATHNLDDRIAWLKNTDHFSVWNHHRLAHFAYALKEKNFNRGDIVVREGDSVQQLIMLRSGVVQSYVHRKDSITGKPKLLRLAVYSEGTFLGETELGGSSSGTKRAQPTTIRAMSSATNNQVTCYYVPRDTYSKFVVKNTDAATSLLRRQLVDLSQARRLHIVQMDRRFQVKERVASAARRARVPRVRLMLFVYDEDVLFLIFDPQF